MVFPILRENLNATPFVISSLSTLNGARNFNPSTITPLVSSLSTLNNENIFIEKRTNNLSKEVLQYAMNGKKEFSVNIVVKANYEPILSSLQANFPDSRFNTNPSTNQIYINWA